MSQVLNLARAFDNFIKGCKADGTWGSIKAGCVMAGWDGLDGALTPLVGTAPTNNNFVSGDYNRETGLVGDGSTKYLDSNRANNADPQDSNHNAVWVSTLGTGLAIASAVTATGANQIGLSGRKNRNLAALLGISMQTGLCGISRSNSADFNYRVGGADNLSTQVSQTTSANNVAILGDADAGYGNHRLSFYSIGESLNLALLDTRVSNLMTEIATAIP